MSDSSRKKKAKEQAAEKEQKRIERERVNQEKRKERRALTERNNLLLQQMTSYLGGRGNEDSFTSDVVSECVGLTTSLTPPPDATHQLEKTITELQSVSPHQGLTIEQLQRTLATLQRSPDEPAVPPTTPVSTTPNASNFHIASAEIPIGRYPKDQYFSI